MDPSPVLPPPPASPLPAPADRRLVLVRALLHLAATAPDEEGYLAEACRILGEEGGFTRVEVLDPRACFRAAWAAADADPAGVPGERFPLSLGAGEEGVLQVGSSRGQTPPLDTATLTDLAEDVARGFLAVRRRTDLAMAWKREVVSRMASGVAHDFNNHLTVMMTAAEILGIRIRPSDPAQQEIRQILDTIDRSSRLLRTVATFRGDPRDDGEAVDLVSVVRDLHGTLQRVGGPAVDVRLDLPAGSRFVVATVPMISQVLLHLVSNARDGLGGAGTVTVRVGADAEIVSIAPGTPADGAGILLQVLDAGAGMDRATRDRAFDPWFTTRGRGKGVGLGLPTVDGVVREHGGTVRLWSAPGRGTTVEVRFRAATP